MRTSRRCFFSLLVLFVLASASLPVLANTTGWPQSGQLLFEVLRGERGLKLGESDHRWQHDGLHYTMSTVMQTTGLAAMLQEFTYTQTSEGQISKGRLQPGKLVVSQRKGNDQAVFDWSNAQVVITRKQRQHSFPIRSGDVDMLGIWHKAGIEGFDAQLPGLQVITNRAAYPVRFEQLDLASIEVPAGRFETRHVRYTAESGSLQIDLWLSVQHAYMPVRVLMVDDKGQALDQRLLRFRVQ